MPASLSSGLVMLAAVAGSLAFSSGCSHRNPGADNSAAVPSSSTSAGLILRASEGERRVRRLPPQSLATLRAPFILKVDRKNGGSSDFVMLYEDIPPGQAITPHHHPKHDEILFIHRGSGVVSLGSRQDTVTEGATIYIPPATRITLRNTGTEPLTIVGIFARPGFEEYLREISVPEGKPADPLSVEELSAIRGRHQEHVIYDRP